MRNRQLDFVSLMPRYCTSGLDIVVSNNITISGLDIVACVTDNLISFHWGLVLQLYLGA